MKSLYELKRDLFSEVIIGVLAERDLIRTRMREGLSNESDTNRQTARQKDRYHWSLVGTYKVR